MSRKATQSSSCPIAVSIEAAPWRKHAGIAALLRRAVRRALAESGAGSVTVLLGDDERLRALNAQFRGQDKPTNVLSFASLPNGEDHLGDIAIAYGTAAREAKQAGKRFADHAAHLAVHGALHLIGYDHDTAARAAIMEPLETLILAAMKIPDPYAAKKKAA